MIISFFLNTNVTHLILTVQFKEIKLSYIMKERLLSLQIRVNAVNPTVVLTDMGRLGWSDPAKAKPMLDQIPLGRFAGKT